MAADTESTLALLSDLRGAVRIRARGDRGGMRLEQHSVGPVGIDRTTFDLDLDADVGPAGKLVFGQVSSGAVGFRTNGAERWYRDGVYLAGQPGHPRTSMIRGGLHDQVVIDPALPGQIADTEPGRTWQPVRFTGYEPVSPQAAQAWKQAYAHIRGTVRGLPGTPGHQLIASMAAQHLVAVALTVFPNNALADPTATDRHGAHPAALRRAIAFIDQHAHEDITIAGVAAAASVTIRAVQLAFRRHLDTTPAAYLRRVRLERAHAELGAADPASSITVAAMARRWGWASPVHFAAAYQQRFGVLPSHTLRA